MPANQLHKNTIQGKVLKSANLSCWDMATNQSSHLTVGTFGVPKKLLDFIHDVGPLHKMTLIQPTNAPFGKMISNCKNSLRFYLRRPLRMEKVAIHVVALFTLASKICTNLVRHVFWEHIWRIDWIVAEVEHPEVRLLLWGCIYLHSMTRLVLFLVAFSSLPPGVAGLCLPPQCCSLLKLTFEFEWDAPSVNEVLLSFLGPQA